MIGQDIDNINLKRFNMVQGAKRSGKTKLVKELANKNNNVCEVIYELNADKVREIINNSHTITTPKYIIIQNGDYISKKNQNMMLKLLEETPEKLTIFIEVINLNKILRTIKSRANIIKLNRYNKKHLKQFTEDKLLLKYCDNIGEVLFLRNFNYKEHIEFIEKIKNSLNGLSFRNLFKITDYTEILDGKFDLEILFIFFNRVFKKYRHLKIIDKFIYRFNNKSLNNLMLFDRMIIELWEVENE